MLRAHIPAEPTLTDKLYSAGRPSGDGSRRASRDDFSSAVAYRAHEEQCQPDPAVNLRQEPHTEHLTAFLL